MFFFVVCFSCLRLLWPLLLQLLWLLSAPEQCLSLQKVCWLPPLWAKHEVCMIWIAHSWFQGTQWGVQLASPLCCSNNNLNPRCLFRHMHPLSWVFHRWILSHRVVPSTDYLCHILVSVMMFAYYTSGGLSYGGLQHHNTLELETWWPNGIAHGTLNMHIVGSNLSAASWLTM